MEIIKKQTMLEIANILVREANTLKMKIDFKDKEDYLLNVNTITQYEQLAETIRACYSSGDDIPAFFKSYAAEAIKELEHQQDPEWLTFVRLKKKFNEL